MLLLILLWSISWSIACLCSSGFSQLFTLPCECSVCLSGSLLVINKYNYRAVSLLMVLQWNRQGCSQRSTAELEARQSRTACTAKHHFLINCLKQWKLGTGKNNNDLGTGTFKLQVLKESSDVKLVQFHKQLCVMWNDNQTAVPLNPTGQFNNFQLIVLVLRPEAAQFSV